MTDLMLAVSLVAVLYLISGWVIPPSPKDAPEDVLDQQDKAW